MQIDFGSSGGVANIELTYQAETSTLPPEQAQELESLVDGSGIFDLEQDDANFNVAVGRADVITYRLSVSDGARQTTLWLNDVTAPASVRPLIAELRRLAMERRSKRE